jgi:putative membrane protein
MNVLIDPEFIGHLVAAIVFSLIGLIFFAIAFVVMAKAAPFSLRKEIEEDHNTALAIIMGSVILGIAIVIGMAIQG